MRALMLPLLLCALSITPTLGCYATLTPGVPGGYEGDEEVTEGPPPVQIETYPAVIYAGTPHYYVGGRWYRRTPRGWGYYRKEPAPLVQRRPPPRPQERHDERPQERHDEHRDERRDEHR
jgi:hypothetical protein